MSSTTVPQLDLSGLRKFGLVNGGIVGILFGLLIPAVLELHFPIWPWVILGVLWLLALSWPKALKPIYTFWMKFGHVMGFINSRIILTVFFFIAVFPTGLIMRLVKKDPMRRALEKNSKSYRIDSKSQSIEHMRRPY